MGRESERQESYDEGSFLEREEEGEGGKGFRSEVSYLRESVRGEDILRRVFLFV